MSRRCAERVIRLSADDFEGRGPGTEGGKRAAQYIADQMKASGVKPANEASYFQNVPMIGLKADPKTVLESATDHINSAKSLLRQPVRKTRMSRSTLSSSSPVTVSMHRITNGTITPGAPRIIAARS